jgi:regulator of RNase E activity RraA
VIVKRKGVVARRGRAGDIVFGDLDGLCVVPRSAERDVSAGAFEKARGEKRVRRALDDGMSAREAFEKFGML